MLVCLEATGTYGNAVAEYLYDRGHYVAMVNPVKAKRFSQMQMKRTSTDQVDALLLAKLIQVDDLAQWKPLSPALQELKELVGARKDYVQERTRYKNRVQAPSKSSVVQRQNKRHICYLDKVIQDFEKAIEALVKEDAKLREDCILLSSIPGISMLTATNLLAEIGEINCFETCTHFISFAGLAPGSKTSGSSVRRKMKMSRFGKRSLRTMMYMPAIAARQHNSIIISLVQKLQKAGKPPLVVHGAAMRKLMRLAYGVLKSREPFDARFRQSGQISA